MWAAIIVAVTLLGRWAFSVDTHAQEGGGPTPTVTPTSLLDEEGDDGDEEKRENVLDCSDPGNSGHPQCTNPDPTSTPQPTSTPRPTFTRTPTPIPTPTKTPTPVTGPPIPFIPTEVPCPPGWTRGPCYAPGGTWTPTPTPLPPSCPPHMTCVTPKPTPTYTPTPQPTTIGSTTVGPGTGSNNNESGTDKVGSDDGGGPGVTPTPGAVPPANIITEPPLYAVVRVDGTRISHTRWSLFDWSDPHHASSTRTVTLEVGLDDPNDTTTNLSDWQFRVHTIPAATGFRVMRGYGNQSRDCTHMGPDSTYTDWTLSTTTELRLIRCGMGTQSGAFKMYARYRNDPNPIREFLIDQSWNIPRAWHQEDGQVAYTIDVARPSQGSRPNTVPSGHYDSDMKNMIGASVRKAAGELNLDVKLGTFTETGDDVTVKTFWRTNSPCDHEEEIACFESFKGTYPHLDPSTIWIRLPPGTPEITTAGAVTEWTSDSNRINDPADRDRYFYLPWVMAHEFGHSLGALHLPYGYLMGPYRVRTTGSPIS